MKGYLLCKVWVLCVCSLLNVSVADAQDAKYYYDKGSDLYIQKQYDPAIIHFTAAISLNPNYADAYIYRGVVYYAKKEYNPAIQDFSKAIGLNANYGLGYYNRGLAYSAIREDDLALQDYTRTIDLDPNYTDAYIYRGNIYYTKKKYDLAIQNYSKAITLNPNSGLIYYNRGLAYNAQNEYDLAIQDYSKTISLTPDYAEAYTYRGNVYYARKMYDLAIQDFSKTISLTPYNADIYIYRGNIYYFRKEYDLAIQDFSKAISLNPNYGLAYHSRGLAYYAKKDENPAIQDFNKVISLEPGNVYAYYTRGLAYNAQNEYDLAIRDYSKAINLDVNYKSAYYSRGVVYYYKGEYDLMIKDCSKAISIDPDYTDAYNNRALAYQAKGEYTLALTDLKKTISLNANYAIGFINIIEPLTRLNRFSEAAGYYNDFRSRKLVAYIDDDSWSFFKKYVEVITKDITVNNYEKALNNLHEAEKLYTSKEQKNDNAQRNTFSSILALKGYVLEQLNRRDEAKQAYEQALVINKLQPNVTDALQRLTQKQEVFVQTDETAPTITILEPSGKRAITIEEDKPTGTQRIRGKAIDAGGIKKMTVNNVPVKVEESGYFETTVNIKEGVNVFTLVASDNNANTSSESVVIETAKEKDRPQPAAKPDIPVLNNAPVYHAVLIAENDYSDPGIKDLPGTVADMRTMYKLLVNNYNFSPANTDTLVNATKVTILESLIQKANEMKENDNLFIFYAGHGQMIKQPDESEEGFLVPADAVKNKRSSYISSNDLTGTIKYSKAKHILFVADACFAGSLFRDISSEAPITVAEAYKDKSRKLLASGNRQAVPDQSEFIEYFRLALQENRTKYITAEQLIDSFKNQYKTTTHLQLQYYPIKNVDDLGGQFVFIRK